MSRAHAIGWFLVGAVSQKVLNPRVNFQRHEDGWSCDWQLGRDQNNTHVTDQINENKLQGHTWSFHKTWTFGKKQ